MMKLTGIKDTENDLTSRELTRCGEVAVDLHEIISEIVMHEKVSIIAIANTLSALLEWDTIVSTSYLANSESEMIDFLNSCIISPLSIQNLLEYGIITEYAEGDSTHYYLASPYKAYIERMGW